jgi:hypothetical protein
MVLWKYDRRVVTILSISLLGTLGVCPRIVGIDLIGSQDIVMGFAAACIYDFDFPVQGSLSTHGEPLRLESMFATIMVVPILVTNVLSTSLIAWKAWYVMWLLVSVLVRPPDEDLRTQGLPSNSGCALQEG